MPTSPESTRLRESGSGVIEGIAGPCRGPRGSDSPGSSLRVWARVHGPPPAVRHPAGNGRCPPCGPDYTVFSIGDRKSTRLNSSHGYISYAVFCLKKKKKNKRQYKAKRENPSRATNRVPTKA